MSIALRIATDRFIEKRVKPMAISTTEFDSFTQYKIGSYGVSVKHWKDGSLTFSSKYYQLAYDYEQMVRKVSFKNKYDQSVPF